MLAVLNGENISFNFDVILRDYIRNRLNTNPQKVNSDVTDASDLKTYWLGESFERHLKIMLQHLQQVDNMLYLYLYIDKVPQA